jgi:hypothetical protein
VYKSYGSGLSAADQGARAASGAAPRDSVFQLGIFDFPEGAPADVAKKLANVGDPFYFLDAKSRTISTVLAEATSSIGVAAGEAGDMSKAGARFAAKADLLSELGISFFDTQKNASIFRPIASNPFSESSKLVVPTRVLQEAFSGYEDESFRGVSLSTLGRRGQENPVINLVWNPQRQLDRAQTRQVVSNIFDIMSDEQRTAKVMGVTVDELDDSVSKEIQHIQSLTGKGDDAVREAIDSATDVAMERGIVKGVLTGEVARRVDEDLYKLGIDLSNDAVSGKPIMDVVKAPGLGPDAIATTPSVADGSTELSGLTDQLKYARGFETVGGEKVSRSILAGDQIAELLDNDKDLLSRVTRNVSNSKTLEAPTILGDLYRKNKGKVALGLAAAVVGGYGYYKMKKSREQSLYDEALEDMPNESSYGAPSIGVEFGGSSGTSQGPGFDVQTSTSGYGLMGGPNNTPQQSYRRSLNSPLSTAGIVQNLDRNKIGHYAMGPNKYDHLYSR